MIQDQEYEELIYRKYFNKLAAEQCYRNGDIDLAKEYEEAYYEICDYLQDFIENYKLVNLYIVDSIN